MYKIIPRTKKGRTENKVKNGFTADRFTKNNGIQRTKLTIIKSKPIIRKIIVASF